MNGDNKKKEIIYVIYWITLAFVVAIIFAIDRAMPPQVTISALYIIPMLMGIYLFENLKSYIILNLSVTLLIILEALNDDILMSGYLASEAVIAVLLINICSLIALKHVKSSTEKESFEKIYLSALEGAPHGVIIVNQTGEIIFSNEQVEKIFAYDKGELLGLNVDLLVPMDMRHKHPEYRKTYARNPVKKVMSGKRDLYGLKKDGGPVPVEVGLTPISTRSGLLVMSTIIDITERIDFLEALKKTNEQLEKKNTELEDFVHMMSHDVKAPLISIHGFTNLTKEIMKGKHEQVEHFLQRISANVIHMERYIDDLLKLSSVSRGGFEVELTRLDEIIKNAMESVEVQIEESGTRIDLPDNLPQIWCNKSLMTQLFINLIDNAIKYRRMDIGCHITVSYTNENNEYILYFSDNGIGLPEGSFEKIFKIFERVNPTAAEGTGIGLALVKKIIERHYGKISVKNNNTSGVCFTIVFPEKSEKNRESI